MENILLRFNLYLTNIIQRAVLGDQTSEWLPGVTCSFWSTSRIHSGPLLFILFINVMHLSYVSSKTGLFAGYTKVYVQIENRTARYFELFQRLYKWSITWKMNFNHSKCSYY